MKFRLVQGGKFVRDMPFPYLLLLLGIVGIGLYALHLFIQDIGKGLICGGVLLGVVCLIHFRRKDFHFIFLASEHPWQVFFMDYLLLSFPILILEIMQGFWFISVGIIVGCLAISFLKQPFHRNVKGFPVPGIIPHNAFEIRANIRRYGGWLMLLYASAYAGLFFPYASLACLWFYTIFFLASFGDCESIAILNVSEKPAGAFLRNKIGLNLRLYLITIVPVCLFYTLIRPGDWWLALGFLVLASLNVALFIVAKYAVYEPNKRDANTQISLGLSVFSILVPFLAPLPLLLLTRYYIKAHRNLNSYLYAYH
ncbi:hypothetical protein M2459_000531 [Parabacteroides sp. PF5-5]|uniref:hypothetical protein n=1 Tax=unclassified Parabacteroides TaxID=2649774 RepID=UPI002476AACB|nr:MULTISPECIES: hypothetical protein [unclassified Parabacteroides]MDH6303535.1 hypothetical protein [Parabacteroides sp. PH5-39]MDH6314857.1 hypothetical protein [Parabacteroides sp. PF5-13]MDH6318194.1 hypothetical protein [Parabacteroides sp. PH5-13]MDH6321873.1 hypothetical protein [Parabacteroides sp. PH5-8]MDH6325997.1 hypothetical protein [Parabacteroides sp. PH5-41]